MANPGVVVTLATLNCICTRAEWQDILKGLWQRHDLELWCLVKFPGISSCLLLLCLLRLWFCLLLDPQPCQPFHNHPVENYRPRCLIPSLLLGSICGSTHKWIQSSGGHGAEAWVLDFEEWGWLHPVGWQTIAKKCLFADAKSWVFDSSFPLFHVASVANDWTYRSHLSLKDHLFKDLMPPLHGSLPVLRLQEHLGDAST